MEFTMPVGIEFFETLRASGCYYVDKSEFIYQVVGNGETSVTLFTRPRRFGKTLTMSMMQSFFDIARDSRIFFEGLAITKHKEFCNRWMNQYPVLFISLKSAVGRDFEKAYGMLKSCIANLCKDHAYLETSDKVNRYDVEILKELQKESANEVQIINSLLVLTRMMYAHYGRQVILLIDEYDVPLAKAHDADRGEKDYYPRMLVVIRGLMDAALKTNRFLKFAVITGCLRISKESIFTGVNNFTTYTILDEVFSNSFGFTEAEVEEILKRAGHFDKMDLVKSWYDGYIFGHSQMFCPWDVACYVRDIKQMPDKEPDNYWKNTSGNDIVDEFVENPGFQVSGKFEILMNGGIIEQTITDQFTYGNLKDKEDHLWSVLFMSGYLTKADKTQKGRKVRLRIPNAEIESIFEDSVVRHFENNIDVSVQREIMEALWSGNEDKVSKLVSDLLWDTISYHDYHENYYHAFVTGMLVSCGCEVESNQENGLGRTDIVIRDRGNRRAIIIEAKKANREDELEKMCLEGSQQIVNKKYMKGLKGYTQIVCYGLSFFEKTALARLLDGKDESIISIK